MLEQYTEALPLFNPFPKIARLAKTTMWITEKIDGTNASIYIDPVFSVVQAASRNRWITPDSDNMGFARWVEENRDILQDTLGPGHHFGEWAGPGIQKNRHGLTEKTFFLFNVGRWASVEYDGVITYTPHEALVEIGLPIRPVPVLYVGPVDSREITKACDTLKRDRTNPEGLMIYLQGPDVYIKHPFNPLPKGRG
jgi:hypothetical protein